MKSLSVVNSCSLPGKLVFECVCRAMRALPRRSSGSENNDLGAKEVWLVFSAGGGEFRVRVFNIEDGVAAVVGAGLENPLSTSEHLIFGGEHGSVKIKHRSVVCKQKANP